MFWKEFAVKRRIKNCKEEIVELEKKLQRSQSNCVRALLENSSPSDKDLEYHSMYMAKIKQLRAEIMELEKK